MQFSDILPILTHVAGLFAGALTNAYNSIDLHHTSMYLRPFVLLAVLLTWVQALLSCANLANFISMRRDRRRQWAEVRALQEYLAVLSLMSEEDRARFEQEIDAVRDAVAAALHSRRPGAAQGRDDEHRRGGAGPLRLDLRLCLRASGDDTPLNTLPGLREHVDRLVSALRECGHENIEVILDDETTDEELPSDSEKDGNDSDNANNGEKALAHLDNNRAKTPTDPSVEPMNIFHERFLNSVLGELVAYPMASRSQAASGSPEMTPTPPRDVCLTNGVYNVYQSLWLVYKKLSPQAVRLALLAVPGGGEHAAAGGSLARFRDPAMLGEVSRLDDLVWDFERDCHGATLPHSLKALLHRTNGLDISRVTDGFEVQLYGIDGIKRVDAIADDDDGAAKAPVGQFITFYDAGNEGGGGGSNILKGMVARLSRGDLPMWPRYDDKMLLIGARGPPGVSSLELRDHRIYLLPPFGINRAALAYLKTPGSESLVPDFIAQMRRLSTTIDWPVLEYSAKTGAQRVWAGLGYYLAHIGDVDRDAPVVE